MAVGEREREREISSQICSPDFTRVKSGEHVCPLKPEPLMTYNDV